jgi:ABC-type multidrug transport system ATPase subunit
MKQRLKLALALFSKSAVVLLDESTSNLDPKGMEWYQTLLNNELENRTFLVGSNFSDTETFLCEGRLELKD